MTHAEVPWRLAPPWRLTRSALPADAPSSEPISNQVMRSFYARHQADPDVAVALVAASSAIEGVELSDEWQEKLRQVAYGSQSADMRTLIGVTSKFLSASAFTSSALVKSESFMSGPPRSCRAEPAPQQPLVQSHWPAST
jgi:hypothetical protein